MAKVAGVKGLRSCHITSHHHSLLLTFHTSTVCHIENASDYAVLLFWVSIAKWLKTPDVDAALDDGFDWDDWGVRSQRCQRSSGLAVYIVDDDAAN